MKFLNKSAALSQVNLKANLVYLPFAWGTFFITILQIFIFYYIWMAVYSGRPLLNGIGREQMIAYVILSRILYTQFSWSLVHNIGEMIHSGDICVELLRPVDFQYSMFIDRVVDFFLFGSITGVPAGIFAASVLGFFSPHDAITVILFLLSLFLASIIAFCIEFWIGLLAFYTNNCWGLQGFYEALLNFFSGALVPLSFLPLWLEEIVDFLPFKDILYSPISIYLGLVKGGQVFETLLSQLAWVICLLACSRLFYRMAVRKVTVHGG